MDEEYDFENGVEIRQYHLDQGHDIVAKWWVEPDDHNIWPLMRKMINYDRSTYYCVTQYEHGIAERVTTVFYDGIDGSIRQSVRTFFD